MDRKIMQPEEIPEILEKDLERITSALDHHAIVSITDADGTIIYANLKFCEISGYSCSELVGQNHSIIRSGRNPPSLYEEMWETISAGEVWHGEIENRKKNGDYYWVETTIVPFPDDAGRPHRYVSIRTDITGVKASERALQVSEDRLRRSQTSANIGTWDWNIANGELYWSERIAPLFGYPEGALETTYENFLNAVHPDDRQYVIDSVNACITRRADYDIEHRIVWPDGSVRWMQETGDVIRDNDGNPLHMLGVVQDITPRKLAEQALQASEARYRGLVESLDALIARTDVNGRFTFVNKAYCNMFGKTEEALIGKSFVPAIHEEDRSSALTEGMPPELLSGPVQVEQRTLTVDGWRWLEWEYCAINDASGRTVEIQGVGRDITERKASELERLHRLAYYDSLTELPNRELCNDLLDAALAQAQRNNESVGVLFLDLDRFKDINDSLGHGFGDRLLKLIAGRLRCVSREQETLARQGGDEFIMILPSLTCSVAAADMAQEIRKTLAQAFCLDGSEFYITASIGISVYPFDGAERETLLSNADTAMYRAKERGRDTYQFYTADMNAQAKERLSLGQDLRRALENDELHLVYQPQVDLTTGCIVGAEALVRWRHPQLGPVPPSTFIPIAEELGLIEPIGEWVLWTAARQAAEWQKSACGQCCIAVNVSGKQLHHERFKGVIEAVLDRTGLQPGLLEVELTESILMGDVEHTVDMLDALSGMGVALAIDDFGTGYSSLSYLSRFSIDKLKIDRSFIKDIPDDQNSMAIAEAIIAMAHALDIRVIAEGVETEQQCDFLRRFGCDEIQGYLFSPPVQAAEITQFVTEQKKYVRGKRKPAVTG